MAKTKLSVVVPCYNEQSRFKNGFFHLYSYLKKQEYKWELIFVNDGSRDETLSLIKSTIKGLKDVKILSYKKNRGKGYAITKGVLASKGQYIFFSDIDHSVQISTVERFFKFFGENYNVVIGSRRVSGSKILARQHPIRELLGRGFTFLVDILIFRGIKDATCGFKAFEKQVAKNLFKKLRVYGWTFDAEILYLCKKYGLSVAQVPVTWSNVKGSKVSLKRDIISSLIGLFKIRINDLRGIY